MFSISVMKARNHAFDLLCGICIVRMVTLHIMNICGLGDKDAWLQVMQWTYFFMSFFFFKAGYFNKGVSAPTWPYLQDRVKRLLVPWACCGLLGNVVYFSFLPHLIERYHKPVETLEWSHIWETASHYGNSPTWFLFSFFMTYVVVHFIEKVSRLHWIVLLFPFCAVWLFNSGNQFGQSGFSAAVGPGDHDELSVLNGHGDVMNDLTVSG